MLYSEKFNLLFIAVPKTGTTSFTSALGDVIESRRNAIVVDGVEVHCGEHDSLADIASRIGWDKIQSMIVVGAVRNPWDRLVSSYHFYRNGRVASRVFKGKQTNPMAILNVIAAKLLPFPLWLRLYRTHTCYHYLQAPSGGLHVDYLLHLESFEEDVSKLCEVLNLKPVEVHHQNKSSRNDYREYYTEATRKHVAHRFADDVKAFNYIF